LLTIPELEKAGSGKLLEIGLITSCLLEAGILLEVSQSVPTSWRLDSCWRLAN
jgi:hypothetical protein